MSVDEAFGPLIMFGAGGTAVEVAARYGACSAAARPQAGARPDEADARVAPAAGLPRLPGRQHRPHRRSPRPAQLARGAPSRDPRDRHQSAAGRRQAASSRSTPGCGSTTTQANPRVPMAIRPYPIGMGHGISTPAESERCTSAPSGPRMKRSMQDFFAKVTPDDQRLALLHRRAATCPTGSSRSSPRSTTRARWRLWPSPGNPAACSGSCAWSPIPTTRRLNSPSCVRSDLKGCGLGWQLMSHLIAYARAEKLQQLHGSVLADNTTMLQMCRELGFSIEREPGDEGVRRVILSLTEPGPSDSNRHPGSPSAAQAIRDLAALAGTYRKARLCACACSACTLRPG